MRDELKQFSLPAGPVAAILLGMALTPFREATSAGNFIFAFVILNILVATYGGRWAALATSGVSALSLDFFLTKPYLSLRIEGKHDLIAFTGLLLCGLVSAALGVALGRRAEAGDAARAHLDLLRAAIARLDGPGSSTERLADLLRDTRNALPLAGLVLKDAGGMVVAASGTSPGPRPDPDARAELGVAGRSIGTLEAWTTGADLAAEDRRDLDDIARLATLLLAAR